MSDETREVTLDDVLAGEDISPAEAEAAFAEDGIGETDEVELLRTELMKLQGELEAARTEAAEATSKHMRALAEVQTVKRRTQGDIDRARERGVDSVIMTVIPVYDDLRRALDLAGDDPASIIPGIQQVRDTLKRNLESVGITEVGAVGDDFNPEFHEALTTMPSETPEMRGKIAQVFESGFMKDNRVIRPARVVVFQD